MNGPIPLDMTVMAIGVVYLTKEIVIPLVTKIRNKVNGVAPSGQGDYTAIDRSLAAGDHTILLQISEEMNEVEKVICRQDEQNNPLLFTLLRQIRDALTESKLG